MNISWSNLGGHDECLGGPGPRVPPVATGLPRNMWNILMMFWGYPIKDIREYSFIVCNIPIKSLHGIRGGNSMCLSVNLREEKAMISQILSASQEHVEYPQNMLGYPIKDIRTHTNCSPFLVESSWNVIYSKYVGAWRQHAAWTVGRKLMWIRC